jgi:hypothetical protein
LEQAVHDERSKEQDLQLQEDDEWLDEALRETFPASDPVPSLHREPQTSKRSDEDPRQRRDSASTVD